MNKLKTFQDFLTTQSVQIPVWSFIINIIIAAVLSYLLGCMYVRYGKALSNRRSLASNFILLTMATMLIISIVKSSLALSLGLVGALSIVRFRAAIKEPEELVFLFLCITIGLGTGADQTLITVLAFIIISVFIILRSINNRNNDNQNLFLCIKSVNPEEELLASIISILEKNCHSVNLKRVDEANELMEVSLLVEFKKFEEFIKTKDELRSLGKSITITFMDNKGLF